MLVQFAFDHHQEEMNRLRGICPHEYLKDAPTDHYMINGSWQSIIHTVGDYIQYQDYLFENDDLPQHWYLCSDEAIKIDFTEWMADMAWFT